MNNTTELKLVTQHYWHAKDARESLESALSEIEEMDASVTSLWDELTDYRVAVKQAITRAKAVESAYEKHMKSLEVK